MGIRYGGVGMYTRGNGSGGNGKWLFLCRRCCDSKFSVRGLRRGKIRSLL